MDTRYDLSPNAEPVPDVEWDIRREGHAWDGSIALQRLVFKFCDRVRRSALPLFDTIPLPRDQEPASLVARADEAARVRIVMEALPCALREATLLYYLTGHDIGEITAFLALPPSTVKNRLQATRKQMRKDLVIRHFNS